MRFPVEVAEKIVNSLVERLMPHQVGIFRKKEIPRNSKIVSGDQAGSLAASYCSLQVSDVSRLMRLSLRRQFQTLFLSVAIAPQNVTFSL